jgi:hypothetical protein
MRLIPGSIVRFTYRFHTGAPPEELTDDQKEVMILNANFQGKAHAIDLKRLTAAEREVLTLIFNPESKGKTHPIPLVNDIMRRMDPVRDVKNPISFYSKFVKVFLKDKDAYRTYYPRKMRGITVVVQSSVQGKVTHVSNARPLFHRVESKPGQRASVPSQKTEPSSKVPNRLELLKQRHAALKSKPEKK